MTMTYTIVGVVGHVNHGKSTLVRVLTGIDTDTLHEEKRRGITIDIGFASFTEGSHRFAIIDAPGHQKYIGNLLVGVSSIDIGLLIVACDQGIQQQTLEHASIIRAIGVKKLIVAISRIDLADAKTVAVLSDELELFLGELGFNEIPIFPVSSVSGDGFDRLKSQMCSYASDLANSDATENDGDFRMPIDRVFTVEGRGLIVAGTIWSGQVRIGDTLEIARCKTSFRVRGIESHGERVESSLRGIRTAINLVGATMDGISRGDELITPGFLIENEQLVVSLEVFADSKEIKCPCTVQLHTATQAFTAHLLGQNPTTCE